jgi:hypothetical protein
VIDTSLIYFKSQIPKSVLQIVLLLCTTKFNLDEIWIESGNMHLSTHFYFIINDGEEGESNKS